MTSTRLKIRLQAPRRACWARLDGPENWAPAGGGIGGRGRMVLPSNGINGVIIDMVLDQNRRTYPYHDPDWQAAAKFYAVKHVPSHDPVALAVTEYSVCSHVIIS